MLLNFNQSTNFNNLSQTYNKFECHQIRQQFVRI